MKRIWKRITVFAAALALVMTMGAVPSQAASAPRIEDVDYEGNGVVEVEFAGDVKYRNVKITVKDSKGKKYKARVVRKDADDIKFKIKKFKKGKKYTFRIKGVKRWNAGAYRTVKGKVKIPGKAKKKSKYIGVAKAKTIALNDAKLKASQVRFTKARFEYDDGRAVYEIEFRRDAWEYEYEIKATNGRITDKDVDYDDDYRPAAVNSSNKPAKPAGQYIGSDKALSIALTRAGLGASQVWDVKVEFDTENGVPIYEVEFKGNGKEFDAHVHAVNSNILKWEVAVDD